MTSTTSTLRLTRNQLAQLTKDPEVIRQLELLIARVNSLESGGGGGTGDLAAIATSGSASDLIAGTVPTARLPLTGVVAGSYTNTSLTVDATGRITAASNGAASGGTFGQATATFTVGLDSVTVSVVDTGVTSGSNIVLSVGTATGREPDEYAFAPVFPVVASVTAGVGFDILVTCPDADADGAYLINYTRD